MAVVNDYVGKATFCFSVLYPHSSEVGLELLSKLKSVNVLNKLQILQYFYCALITF